MNSLSTRALWSASIPCALIVASAVGVASPALAQWVPNEKRVSPNPALIDYEISQSRKKIAWTDPKGNLWLANINKDTGDFEPKSGQGTLVATGTVSGWNEFMWNGPEWLATASGDQIFYSFYLPGKKRIAANTRMAIAAKDANGSWVPRALEPNIPRMSHIASRNKGDENPQIKYLDPNLNQYWRNVLDPNSEQLMPFIPPSNKSWRFASGMRALMYALPVNGVQQVFRYKLDTGVHQQLTFDAGDKDTGRTVPWLWRAPEFGNDFVLATIVNGSELRIYRQVSAAGEALALTPVYSASLPAGSVAGSPEWFIYNKKSYVFMAVYVGDNTYPSEIWISNIDAAAPLMRRINDNTLLRARNDPEVFITSSGPLIYYNRYDSSIDPDHPLCSACSEGVYRADPGLGAQ